MLCAVIGLLVIRPWGDAPADRTSGQAASGAPVSTDDGGGTTVASGDHETGQASPAAPLDPLRETCASPSGWRAATLQAWAGRAEPIRSWIAIEPVPATGPLDPRIAFAPVATGTVTAIGYCAPLGEGRPPAVAATSLWAIVDGVATPLSLVPLEPTTPNALGGLWLAPPEVDQPIPRAETSSPSATTEDLVGASPDSSAGAPAPGRLRLWPPGRYAIRIAAPGGVYERWLGVEIADLSLLHLPERGLPLGSPASSPSP